MIGIAVVVLVIAAVAVASAALTRRMRREGYSGVGGTAIVRCREGHLFTTTWVPLVSFTSIRLGRHRYQRCPVGHNWTVVSLVKDSDLSDDDRAEAARFRS